MADIPTTRLLRIRDLEQKVGLSRATIYRRIAAGTFPRPRQVGEQAVAWVESEVDTWIGSRPVAGTRSRAA